MKFLSSNNINNLINNTNYFKFYKQMKKSVNSTVKAVNMAFGKGSESKEPEGFAKYVGVAPFYVLGVNMTMAEMQSHFPDRNYTKEFDYAYDKEGEAKGTFVTFTLQSDNEYKDCEGVNLTMRATYLVKDEISYSKDRTKLQIINKYGDTLWLSVEDFNNKIYPNHAITSAWIQEGVRPALVGEEKLIEFLKAYIGIPNSRNYTNEAGWSAKTGKELEEAEAGFTLEEIKKIANGDVSAIKEAIKLQPNNKIKFLLGVRTTSDNKEYNEVYSRMPIRFAVTNYKKLDKEIQDTKAGGGLSNTSFGVYPYKLTKYEVGMTDFSNSNNDTLAPEVDPFAAF